MDGCTRVFAAALPAGCRLDRMQQLPVARENVHYAVRARRGKQSSLRVPREDHRPLPVVPRIDHKQRIHELFPFSPSLPLSLSLTLSSSLSPSLASQSSPPLQAIPDFPSGTRKKPPRSCRNRK